ncbi:MAG: chemotaxis protein CheW [Treponemataceae bacterium]|nr:chemotaxis protein CheW [Treponemataceae bacterium]
MSDALYNDIVASQNTDTQSEEKASGATWLVFRTGSENYAIDSAEVKEIVRNTELFPLPFVPPYVKGVLNSYGIPYAVVDLSQLLGEDSTAERLFLILKNKNNVALQVADIQEFHHNSEVAFHGFTDSADAGTQLFLGTISFDDVIAPVLHATALIDKVRSDIE